MEIKEDHRRYSGLGGKEWIGGQQSPVVCGKNETKTIGVSNKLWKLLQLRSE